MRSAIEYPSTSAVCAAVCTVAAALTFAGCGGEESRPSVRPTEVVTQVVTTTATATTAASSTSTAPVVDPEDPTITCSRLLTTTDHFTELVDFWTKDSVTVEEIDAAYRHAERLLQIGERATADLRGPIDIVVEESIAFLDRLTSSPGKRTTDTTPFKNAGRDISEYCDAVMSAYVQNVTPDEPNSPKPTKQPKPNPVTVPGDGVFEVGRDIPPGTYRSPGTKGPGYSCVVYASQHPSDLATYLRGSTVEGPTIITVYDGEFLNTQFCKSFTKD